MKIPFLFLIVCLLTACKAKPSKANRDTSKSKIVKVLPASYKASNKVISTTADTADIDEQRDAYANYYIVVADTGLNYYLLRDKMFELNKSSNIPIDTMDRGYNKAKDLIALSDKDEDEIYAGEYYPRRYPSKTLSLEYLDTYRYNTGPKTIALVAGIYENKNSADSAFQVIDKLKTAFVFKGRVYVGCMH
ncbi:hypothetical protein [Mucilaginibacter rubeus]|uniref:Uncharacterized protein n=1 Tax=Mucilaginibacter rubeus TaxID=2027860 RepID=A0A5C1I6L4_9SPHI|nr:hypothetical protein [Mucilaginibacter rubeus]QEM12551.1 hypothetical protein DEO27_021900 [Mucilaginibacter rubeus]